MRSLVSEQLHVWEKGGYRLPIIVARVLMVLWAFMIVGQAQAVALPAGHFFSSTNCQGCHADANGGVLTRMDHTLLLGSGCTSCHNNSRHRGKTDGHIQVTGGCDSCHQTTSWLPFVVDHNSTLGVCVSCHRKDIARRASHVAASVAESCGTCHYTTQWATSVSVASFHGSSGLACSSCHDPSPAAPKPVTYVPISIDDITIVIPVENRKLVPADPGLAGDEVVVGVDTDGNGMRDDVQRFITLNYSQDGVVKFYAENMAMAQLDVISRGVNQADVSQIAEAVNRMDRNVRCMAYRFPSRAAEITADIYANVMSTKERGKAYLAATAKLNGKVIRNDDLEFHSEWCR